MNEERTSPSLVLASGDSASGLTGRTGGSAQDTLIGVTSVAQQGRTDRSNDGDDECEPSWLQCLLLRVSVWPVHLALRPRRQTARRSMMLPPPSTRSIKCSTGAGVVAADT